MSPAINIISAVHRFEWYRVTYLKCIFQVCMASRSYYL